LALPQPVSETIAQPVQATDGHIRRCAFRRLIKYQQRPLPLYDVECLYPDRLLPIPLGDLESARPICNACTARPVFRPDED
jgi:hypothetical protein